MGTCGELTLGPGPAEVAILATSLTAPAVQGRRSVDMHPEAHANPEQRTRDMLNRLSHTVKDVHFGDQQSCTIGPYTASHFSYPESIHLALPANALSRYLCQGLRIEGLM